MAQETPQLNVEPEIEVKILDQRIHTWGMPSYKTELSAGIDLYACCDEPIAVQPNAKAILVPTGLSVHMDTTKFFGAIVPRSGTGHKQGIIMGNTIGVIDADYQGQMFLSLWRRSNGENDDSPIWIMPGDRLAQLIFVPVVRPIFKIVDEFASSTIRGAGGFGHTGVSA